MRYNKGVTKPSSFDALTVRMLPVDHPDAQTLSDAQQRELGSIFGFDDLNRLDPVPFTNPGGAFVVVYDGDDLVACGGVSALSALPGHAEIIGWSPSSKIMPGSLGTVGSGLRLGAR
ncbi:MAG: hypothetical protein EBT22_05900 [Chloroflexi bacterium]|nr:hypothetical protein [Chloroflexota bacterium]